MFGLKSDFINMSHYIEFIFRIHNSAWMNLYSTNREIEKTFFFYKIKQNKNKSEIYYSSFELEFKVPIFSDAM